MNIGRLISNTPRPSVPFKFDNPIQNNPNPRVSDQTLKSPEIINIKRKELSERAFTTFCLGNWDETQIDSLAEFARTNVEQFLPYDKDHFPFLSVWNEADAYNPKTTTIRRSFVIGDPITGFKEVQTDNPFADDGSLMAHPFVNSALSHIFELLPNEIRPDKDCFQVSLIRQCASTMPTLKFGDDKKRQVFNLVLASNLEETDGAKISVRIDQRAGKLDGFSDDIPCIKGNGYLIEEYTGSRQIYVSNKRAAFSTKVTNPELITLRIFVDDAPVCSRIGDYNLKLSKVIDVKRKELSDRSFTTFCLSNWDKAQIDSLAAMGRKNIHPFLPLDKQSFLYTSVKHETDSYDKTTSFIRRAFLTGSPSEGFKELQTDNPFTDDGSLMDHLLVRSVLSHIFELLPNKIDPEKDCFEISLINQRAPNMPELPFHKDNVKAVFIVVLACNFSEADGAEMSVRVGYDYNQEIGYNYSTMPSRIGNGYLINEWTFLTVNHNRNAWHTQVTNPERITLRILVTDKSEPFREVI